MKYILTLLLISFSSLTYSQCDYSHVEYNNTTGKGVIKSYPYTLDFYETPMNGRLLLISLIRAGNQYFMDLEITKDSSAQDLEPICLESGSRLSFLLKNNTSISLPHVEDKICGIKTYDRKSGYTSVSNYGLFMITQSGFDELLKSEITLIKITDKDYKKSFVIKDELEAPVDDGYKITKPSRFFIDNIKCMTNPKFE